MVADGYGRYTPTLAGYDVLRVLRFDAALSQHVGDVLALLTLDTDWVQVGDPVSNVVQAAFVILDSFYGGLMIGAVMSFLGAIPEGWLALDGSTYQQVDYPELTATLDAVFRDDGAGTFTLPDVTGRFLVSDGGGYALGDIGGEAAHVLTVGELPPHSHSYTEPQPPTLIGDNGPGIPSVQLLTPGVPTGTTGSGEAHENRPPFLAVRYAIFSGRG